MHMEQHSSEVETTPLAMEELESLDAPSWGSTFWTGAGFGLAVGVLIWT